MDDEIIYSWCLNFVEWFDSTSSAAIIVLVKNLESLSSLRSQHRRLHARYLLRASHCPLPPCLLLTPHSFANSLLTLSLLLLFFPYPSSSSLLSRTMENFHCMYHLYTIHSDDPSPLFSHLFLAPCVSCIREDNRKETREGREET